MVSWQYWGDPEEERSATFWISVASSSFLPPTNYCSHQILLARICHQKCFLPRTSKSSWFFPRFICFNHHHNHRHHHSNYHWRKKEYALALRLSLEHVRIVHQLWSLGNGSRPFLTNVSRNHSSWPTPISFHFLCSTSALPLLSFYAGHCGT